MLNCSTYLETPLPVVVVPPAVCIFVGAVALYLPYVFEVTFSSFLAHNVFVVFYFWNYLYTLWSAMESNIIVNIELLFLGKPLMFACFRTWRSWCWPGTLRFKTVRRKVTVTWTDRVHRTSAPFSVSRWTESSSSPSSGLAAVSCPRELWRKSRPKFATR